MHIHRSLSCILSIFISIRFICLGGITQTDKWFRLYFVPRKLTETVTPYTLRLHYNAVLYNADSIITRSPRGSQIFSQYNMCENVSRRSRFTQCKLCNSYSLCIFQPSLTPLISPRGGVNGHSIYKAYIIGHHV